MISARSSGRLHAAEGVLGSRQGRARRRGARRRPLRAAFELQERTLDQFLKGNSSALTFFGITLGIFVSRKFFALPIAVAVMLAQDSLGMAGLSRVRQAVRGS